jgi:hypothetical protein
MGSKATITNFHYGLASNFLFVYRTLSMRQKTKKHRNQRSIDKKKISQSRRHMPRCVRLVQKTRAKNSHAWAPLRKPLSSFFFEIDGFQKLIH